MRRHRIIPLAVVILFSALPPVFGQVTTSLESLTSNGSQASLGAVANPYGPLISADLRMLAFQSLSSDLVPGDTNDDWDVFVRDRVAHTLTRVSVTSQGDEGHTYSHVLAMSGDGKSVTFLAKASFPDPWNSLKAVFLHDLTTGSTTRISDDHGSADGGTMSFDARYIAFWSSSSQLVPGDTNGYNDVFVYDRMTGTVTRVSVDSSGVEAKGESVGAFISRDGGVVAFSSGAANLVPNDTNGHLDVFIHDLQTGETARVSVSSSGEQGNDDSIAAGISADGRHVSFESHASNFWPGDGHGTDVFVHDRVTGATKLASISSSGERGNNDSDFGSLSGDGRYVAFWSLASNLVPGDADNAFDVFVHDLKTDETRCASVDLSGAPAGGGRATMSADGRYVVFDSGASDLVQQDNNGAADVFLRGARLRLDAEPASVMAGEKLTLTTTFGAPGNPTTLWATSINGAPTFLLLIKSNFDPTGTWTISGTVPPGLGPSTIVFRTLALGAPGQIVSSNDQAVLFQ